ncbi:hypothetical protein DFH06DRAFT_1333757 [Mycena polygramma]|nr:hypothetical protein DFH06DRAFT_1333757 [Mycena polygramma]
MRACPARLISVSALASATLLVRSHDPPHLSPWSPARARRKGTVSTSRIRASACDRDAHLHNVARQQRGKPPCLITEFKIVSWRLSASFPVVDARTATRTVRGRVLRRARNASPVRTAPARTLAGGVRREQVRSTDVCAVYLSDGLQQREGQDTYATREVQILRSIAARFAKYRAGLASLIATGREDVVAQAVVEAAAATAAKEAAEAAEALKWDSEDDADDEGGGGGGEGEGDEKEEPTARFIPPAHAVGLNFDRDAHLAPPLIGSARTRRFANRPRWFRTHPSAPRRRDLDRLHDAARQQRAEPPFPPPPALSSPPERAAEARFRPPAHAPISTACAFGPSARPSDAFDHFGIGGSRPVPARLSRVARPLGLGGIARSAGRPPAVRAFWAPKTTDARHTRSPPPPPPSSCVLSVPPTPPYLTAPLPCPKSGCARFLAFSAPFGPDSPHLSTLVDVGRPLRLFSTPSRDAQSTDCTPVRRRLRRAHTARIRALLRLRQTTPHGREGRGWVYLVASVPDDAISDFRRRLITPTQLLAVTALKGGHTKRMARRRAEYSKCNGSPAVGPARTLVWICRYIVRRRCFCEQLLHLRLFQHGGVRAAFPCRCKVAHREFHWLHSIGGVSGFQRRMAGALRTIGESVQKEFFLPSRGMEGVFNVIRKS